eukprot:5225674-Pleurochrysis_carterae.AAC.1
MGREGRFERQHGERLHALGVETDGGSGAQPVAEARCERRFQQGDLLRDVRGARPFLVPPCRGGLVGLCVECAHLGFVHCRRVPCGVLV